MLKSLPAALLISCLLFAVGPIQAAWVNESNLPAEADYAVLEFPGTFASGATSPSVYGRIYEAGITESIGPNGVIIAEVGYGPTGTDPRNSAQWQWFPASFNSQVGNDDEYVGTLNFAANGTFSYAFRFSANGGIDFTAADLDGAGSNAGQVFDPVRLGLATVANVPPLRLSIRPAGAATVAISWASSSQGYYVLYERSDVTSVDTKIAEVPGIDGPQELIRPGLPGNSFFTLERVPPPRLSVGLVINEVDYDSEGTDTGEFIELYNSSTVSIDLNGTAVVLINGANNQEYARVNLSGSLAPAKYLVLANPNVNVAAETVVIPMADNFIQNGAPDGIALYSYSNHQLLDALAYEGAISAAVIQGEAVVNLVEGTALASSVVDSNTVNGSLIRSQNGVDTNNANADWRFTSTPTPGSANVLSP